MKKQKLLYKLTGTETPRFISEREDEIIDKCLVIINDLEKDAEQNAELLIDINKVNYENRNRM